MLIHRPEYRRRLESDLYDICGPLIWFHEADLLPPSEQATERLICKSPELAMW